MSIAATMDHIGVSQRTLARESGQSLAAVNAIVARGQWPKRGTAAARAGVCAALRKAGATTAELREVSLPPEGPVPGLGRPGAGQALPKEMAPSAPTPGATDDAEAPRPSVAEINQNPTTEEEPMLLQFTPITLEARKAFGLPRSPFVHDIESRDDVFQSAATRYARAALLDAARHHGFIGLVGESGAGKSTLVAELEQRLIDEGRDVLIIKPYTLGMEASDAKGKTLRSTHIAEAIAFALDPGLKIKSSPQARFDQLAALLKASRRAGRRHLLVIDEAHCMPVATIKHLKRFIELVDGFQRLMGVALVAQPELRQLLHSQNPEVREVMQRIELVELEPLDNELEHYLAHKFKRFDLALEQVFEKDAFDAIRARLIHVPRGARVGISTCYPLAVHNLVARAMNGAAAAGWPKVDAQCVAGC